jgi:hypothetical protein
MPFLPALSLYNLAEFCNINKAHVEYGSGDQTHFSSANGLGWSFLVVISLRRLPLIRGKENLLVRWVYNKHADVRRLL